MPPLRPDDASRDWASDRQKGRAMTGGSRRALILDRDGVINHDSGFVCRIADCHFIEGIFPLAAAFTARGFAIVVATNQSGIGRGYFGEQDFASVMDWMKSEFAARGSPIAAVYHCPYHPTAGIGPYRRNSEWRKPKPGMILQASADLDLDLGRSWCVGDKARDIEAARAACVGTKVLFDPAGGPLARWNDYWVVPRLADIIALLAQHEADHENEKITKINGFLTMSADYQAVGPDDEL